MNVLIHIKSMYLEKKIKRHSLKIPLAYMCVSTVVKNIIPETKTLTFKHFFPKLLSFYKHLDFSVRKDYFRLQINLNLNENLKIFMDKFPKFDIKYTAFYRKKKKTIEKSIGKKIK